MSSLQNNIRKVSKPPNYIYTSVTPDDVVELEPGVSVIGINGSGIEGSIAIEQLDGSTFTFDSVKPGDGFFCNAVKILATGTTATGIFVGRLN